MKTLYYINNIQCSIDEFYDTLKSLPVLSYRIEDVSNEKGHNHRYLYV